MLVLVVGVLVTERAVIRSLFWLFSRRDTELRGGTPPADG
jgi:hypothetical protein